MASCTYCYGFATTCTLKKLGICFDSFLVLTFIAIYLFRIFFVESLLTVSTLNIILR